MILAALLAGACASSSVPGESEDAGGGGGDVDAAAPPSDAGPPGDGAVSTCGDGVLQEFEQCDPHAGNVPPERRCDCNDNDPCTLDRCAAGTSADACDCQCEHVLQYDSFGIGTCNDGDACTNDVIHCGPGYPANDMSCANVCAIESCQNDPIAGCAPGCGNGVLDAWETCDDSTGDPATACSCDDGNACTLDVQTGGSASTCTLTCLQPHPAHTGFGYTTCDDGLSCTTDVVVNGTPDPATCQISCQNTPTPGWAEAQCAASDLACVHYTPLPSSADPSQCRVDCVDHLDTTWLSSVCSDGLACTTDVVASYDTTFPADPATCDVACTHGLDGTWYAGQIAACSAARPPCLTFSATNLSFDSTSPADPATCDADCHFALDPAWLASACNDADACTNEAPSFLQDAAQIDAAGACPAEVAYTCGRHDTRLDAELCNGGDDDCDGVADDGCPGGVESASPTPGTTYGGSGGSGFALSCPPGAALVGFDGRSGARVDALTPVCAPILVDPVPGAPERSYVVRTGTATTLGTVGGTGGSVFGARCPANQVVVAIQGRSGDNVDQIAFRCAELTITHVAASWLLAVVPGAWLPGHGGGGGSPFAFACPAGSIATGATGRAGDRVDRFGLVCSAAALTGLTDVRYAVVARHSGQCLGVTGAGTGEGAGVEQVACADAPSQRWHLQSTGDGYARLVAEHSHQCLDVPNGTTTNGNALWQWPCWDGAPQRFGVVDQGGGFVHLVALASGLCVDVAGGSMAEHAGVIQWSCGGAADAFNQQWRLVAAP